MELVNGKRDFTEDVKEIPMAQIASLRRGLRAALKEDGQLFDEYFVRLLWGINDPSPEELVDIGAACFWLHLEKCRKCLELAYADTKEGAAARKARQQKAEKQETTLKGVVEAILTVRRYSQIPLELSVESFQYADAIQRAIKTNGASLDQKNPEDRVKHLALVTADGFYRQAFPSICAAVEETFSQEVAELRAEIVKKCGDKLWLLEKFDSVMQDIGHPLPPIRLFRLGFMSEMFNLAVTREGEEVESRNWIGKKKDRREKAARACILSVLDAL